MLLNFNYREPVTKNRINMGLAPTQRSRLRTQGRKW